MQKLYRYEITSYVYYDDDLGPCRSCQKSQLRVFYVFKETEKSFRIAADWDKDGQYLKTVRKNARKKFAWPTEKEAAQSLLARKKKQIQILEEQLKRAKNGFWIADELVRKFDKL